MNFETIRLGATARQNLAVQLDYEKERQRELLDRPSFKKATGIFRQARADFPAITGLLVCFDYTRYVKRICS